MLRWSWRVQRQNFTWRFRTSPLKWPNLRWDSQTGETAAVYKLGRADMSPVCNPLCSTWPWWSCWSLLTVWWRTPPTGSSGLTSQSTTTLKSGLCNTTFTQNIWWNISCRPVSTPYSLKSLLQALHNIIDLLEFILKLLLHPKDLYTWKKLYLVSETKHVQQ